MAANTRAKGSDTNFAQNEIVSYSQFNIVDVNAAQSVNRNSSTTGVKDVAWHWMGSTDSSVPAISLYDGGNIASGPAITFANGSTHVFSLDCLPVDHAIHSVSVWMRPVISATDQPTVLPAIYVFEMATGNYAPVEMANSIYTWSNATNFNAGFTLTTANIDQTVHPNRHYMVMIRAATGNTSSGAMLIYGMTCNMTLDLTYGGADFSFWA